MFIRIKPDKEDLLVAWAYWIRFAQSVLKSVKVRWGLRLQR